MNKKGAKKMFSFYKCLREFISIQGTLIEDSKKLLTTSATYELFGYVNHFGAKVVEGHYTACIKTETVGF